MSNFDLSSLKKTLGETSGSRTLGAGLAMGAGHTRIHKIGSGNRVQDHPGGAYDSESLTDPAAGLHKHDQVDGRSDEAAVAGDTTALDDDEESDSESVPSFSRYRSSSDSSTSTESSLSIGPPASHDEIAVGIHSQSPPIETQTHTFIQTYPEAHPINTFLDEKPSTYYASSTSSSDSTAPIHRSPPVKRKQSMLAGLFSSKRKNQVPAPIRIEKSQEDFVEAKKAQSPRSPLFDWKFKNHYAVHNVRAGQTGMNRRSWGYSL